MAITKADVVSFIENMSVLELAELVKELEAKFGVSAAKVLSRFAKEQQATFKLKAGVLSGKIISVADIQALADLPSREVLLAKLLGTIQAPTANFVGVLAAVPGSFVRLLGAINAQKEGN